LLATVALTGCGELADGNYRGEPLAELVGNVVVEEGAETPDGELRVGLFWSGEQSALLHEQDVATELEFPARYTLTVFNPPPEEAIREVEQLEGAFAVGIPLIYQDLNGDGRLDLGVETIIGAAVEVALVYTDDELDIAVDWGEDDDDSEDGPEFEELEPGFHMLESEAGLCALGTWLPFELTTIEQADILVGSYKDLLVDVDCDEDADEWWEDEEDDEEDECEEECGDDAECLDECED